EPSRPVQRSQDGRPEPSGSGVARAGSREITPLSALTSIINRPSPEPHPRTRRGMQQGLPQVSAL
ncbi:MAG: hypothetical protein KDB51_11705, partial [Propionibacteriaceae bacterium]|nr:hypothetical protein [Propionibacteriaceae bacterium]